MRPNTAFRRLRGSLSPGEFAATVRRAAHEIGEQVSCDARYIGRVEAGEIRCPNYAYARVFRHMFPGLSLSDMGFAPRRSVRSAGARRTAGAARSGEPIPQPPDPRVGDQEIDHGPHTASHTGFHTGFHTETDHDTAPDTEESDVLRRVFMTGGPMAVAAASLPGAAAPDPPSARPGAAEAAAVEQAVRRIRLQDDQQGADSIYRQATRSLRTVYQALDAGARRQAITERLQHGAGELAISVGWLAHDSGRPADARAHYAEALATARVADDPALEAHAFCNTAFLARDTGRPREAVRAAQAGQAAARDARCPTSPRLLSLLALREAGGWAGLADRSACEEALSRAKSLFERGTAETDPEWMSFFGAAELAGLEAQCRSRLGDWGRAAACARQAVGSIDPHFTRNSALFTAQLADDLVKHGAVEEAAAAAGRTLARLESVRSARIRAMLAGTAGRLGHYREEPAVADFLERHSGSV